MAVFDEFWMRLGVRRRVERSIVGKKGDCVMDGGRDGRLMEMMRMGVNQLPS